MRTPLGIFTLASALTMSGIVVAHEGHEHIDERVMGTVVQVHSAAPITHIEVKTSKGEDVVLTADQATKFIRDGKAAALADIKTGMRIVAKVTHDGQVTKASEISLGVVDPAADHAAQHEDATPHKH